MTGAFPTKTLLCRMYEKTSARGTTYFRGPFGAANVVLLKSKEISENGEPIWELFVQERTAAPALKVTSAPALFKAPSRRLPLTHEPMSDDPVDDLWPGDAS